MPLRWRLAVAHRRPSLPGGALPFYGAAPARQASPGRPRALATGPRKRGFVPDKPDVLTGYSGGGVRTNCPGWLWADPSGQPVWASAHGARSARLRVPGTRYRWSGSLE